MKERLPRGWRAVAWLGVIAGVLAAFVALPPVSLRSPVPSVVIGLFALTVGIGSWIRGERRVGGYAIAAGVFGFALGYLATRSSLEHLEATVVWGALFAAMLRYATPLVFASLGGLFSERSGVVNIGLEGMMLMGAFFAIWGSDVTGNWILGLAIGIGAGGLMGLLHAFFAITLRADQIVGGTAINFLALGLTSYLFIKIYGRQGTPTDLSTIPNISLGFLDRIPGVGGFLYAVFGDLNLMIWVGIALVFVVWVAVFKTPLGLRLRSVGEHPRAADTLGINVYAIRYGAVVLSGMLAAAGGAYLSIGFVDDVREEHDRRPRVHRARRPHLRELASRRRCCRVPAVRVLERTRQGPARVLDVGVCALRGAPVRADTRRRRGRHRPLDPSRVRWPPLQEAIAWRPPAIDGPRGPSSWACSRRSRCLSRSSRRGTPLPMTCSRRGSRSRLQWCSAIAAVVLARRARAFDQASLGRAGGATAARAGRLLGILGICMAASATIAVAVYELLVAVE